MRALHRDDVPRLLDDADEREVTPLVQADRAAGLVGEVEADLAETHLRLHLADRVGQAERVLLICSQEVEGEALRGPLPDAGQLAELGDQPLDGRGVQGEATPCGR